MSKATVTQAELKALVCYDESSGVFTRNAPTRRTRVGAVAGNLNQYTGYMSFVVRGRRYLSHRLAWLYMTGEYPYGFDIDHIDGNKSNNAFSNLRKLTRGENLQNRKGATSHNQTGVLGVGKATKVGNFRARVTVNGKEHHLGTFASQTDAHEAYLSAKRRLHVANTL